MTRHIAPANQARPFVISKKRLARVALAMALYGLCIVYPTYVVLRLVWGPREWAGWGELGWVALFAGLFGLYAYREMVRLTIVGGERS